MATYEDGLMNAITLWQPWATLIAYGLKRIETRTHRGLFGLLHRRIAIHAGRRWDDYAEETALSVCRSDRREQILQAIREARAHMGQVVCTAVVRETRVLGPRDAEAALCEITDNRYGLVLSEIRRFPNPVPATGKQGIWLWTPGGPADTIATVTQARAEAQQRLF